MRFGLHSGPVTAGVLRVSQNARFQLFGDTVNTAARMESNGSPGMIHLSQETANELTANGKQSMFNYAWVFLISGNSISCSPMLLLIPNVRLVLPTK
jgi:class 3 adenylate cyclase